jgi:hypothetical protein
MAQQKRLHPELHDFNWTRPKPFQGWLAVRYGIPAAQARLAFRFGNGKPAWKALRLGKVTHVLFMFNGKTELFPVDRVLSPYVAAPLAAFVREQTGFHRLPRGSFVIPQYQPLVTW